MHEDPPVRPVTSTQSDACTEAAARLRVVIRMLHEPYCETLGPGHGAVRHTAHGLRQVVDALRDIRDLLQVPGEPSPPGTGES